MSKAMFNIMIRTVKHRIEKCEEFEDIISSYPKLTKKEIKQIKEAVNE